MESFGIAAVAGITVICYLVGMVCKASEHVKDEIIPAVVGVAGGILGVVAYFTKMPEFADFHILTAIAVGIVSGLASTGANQLIVKQPAKAGGDVE